MLVDFDNDASSQSGETESDDQAATARPQILQWGAVYADEVHYQDYSDPRKDVVNPLGDPYDPPVTRRAILPTLTLQRYQSVFSPATILAYVDHVSSGVFYGAPAGRALMTGIEANQQIEDGVLLWLVTYSITFSTQTDGNLQVWNALLLYFLSSNLYCRLQRQSG